jgi:hypothetical protein
MPKTNTIPQVQNANRGSITLQPGDTTVAKLLFRAGTNDSIIESILMANDDSGADSIVQLIISDGTNSFVLDSIKVPASYGIDGVHPAVDGLASAAHALNSAGKKTLTLMNGSSLSAKVVTAVASGKTVTINLFAGDF